VSKAIKQIVDDLVSRPEDFSCNELYLVDSKTGFEYWVANGLWFYHLNKPFKLGFNWLDKYRLHVAFTKWREAKVVFECVK
jgi:hypothetical protein